MDNEIFNDHISQGIALMSAANYPAAKAEFEEAIRINVRSAEAYTHLGNACANLGELDEALAAFKNALVVEPNSAETLFSIASIYLMKNDRLRAVEYYNKAEEAGFKRAELYQILATLFFEIHDSAQALRNITKAIAVAPFDGEARVLKARIYLADNRYDEALDTLEDMQKVLPDAFEAYDLRTQIYSGLGKHEEALRVAEMGCSRFPNDAVLALTKLKVLVAMQDDDAALELIEAMKKMPQYDAVVKESVLQEAIVYLRKEDATTAIKILTAVNEKLGGDSDVLYVLLDLYGKLDNHEKTSEIADKLIALNPNYFYLYTAKFFKAHSAEHMGKTDSAKAQYRKLTSELRKATINNPSFYEGYIYRLLCHTRIGEYDKALSLADYIENLHPDRADGHAYRHYIYKTMGDTEKAEAEKQLALKLNPGMNL